MSSFYIKIKKHSRFIRFHTPGHSGRLPKALIKTDITELFYSDNLLNPKDGIKKLEKKLSSIYLSDSAFISANGATNSLMTAIYALKDKGAFLIVGDAHSSVYNALRVFNLQAYYISDIKSPEDIPADVQTVIITSPNYFGCVKDIKRQKELIKDKFIILDMSHGSHFIFSQKDLFESSTLCDLVVCSLHKTLPVATGGAVLLSYNKDLSQRCFEARKLLHSTSPSYIVLSSISRAFEILEKKGEKLYQKVKQSIDIFKRKSQKIGVECIENDDYTRLVIATKYEGGQIEKALVEKGVVPEMSYLNQVIFIVTPYNCGRLFRLYRALKKVLKKPFSLYLGQDTLPQTDKAVKLEFGKDYEIVELERALGRKAYKGIGLYLPRTPLIRPAETITREKLDIILNNLDRCFGLDNGGIAVISYKDGGRK
ncbi:MAG: hypothetical protein QM214_06485 [Bacillota bacterium]|jgi:arginine/lysine/ornithine decarboxylase|nr:hypothetical protein [Bacillota bacterium]